MTASCPWCGYEGKTLKATKPRPSSKRTRMCPSCFGEVTTMAPGRDEFHSFLSDETVYRLRESTDVE